MKAAILSSLITRPDIISYAKKTCKGNDMYKDILSELYLYLYDKDEEWLKELNDGNKLFYYAIKIVYLSWNSPTSPFYKKYRNTEHDDVFCPFLADDETPEENKFDTQKWFDRFEQDEDEISKKRFPVETRLIKLYIQYGSYRKVAKEVGIPHTTVCSVVTNYVKKLKNE